jgi:hypothetical protein
MTLRPNSHQVSRTLFSLAVSGLSLLGQVSSTQAVPIRSAAAAAATKIACPYAAQEFSDALGYDFEATDTGSSETPGVKSSNCSFATGDYEFVVSVSVSRWASKARFAKEWKAATAAYAAIVGAPLIAVPGTKDNAKVAANEKGKVQVALTYTSGTSLVAVTLSSSPSAAKAFGFKPEIVKLRHKKV